MRYWFDGYELMHCFGEVEADSPEEAIKKAMSGKALSIDSEPQGMVYPERWMARVAPGTEPGRAS